MNPHSSYFDFPLARQQAGAFEALCRFAGDADARVFVLRGYAGTGKTTLMSGFIKWLSEKRIPYSLLATTGRAAKILSDKTGADARTIHSLIYNFNKLSEDLEKLSEIQKDIAVDDTGQLKLIFDLAPVMQGDQQRLYIIDEASMISDREQKSVSFAKFGSGNLLADLFDYDKTGKFVFIGDPSQLPPISQPGSPALNRNYLASEYKMNVCGVDLTEILRQQKDNDIIQASLKIRRLYQSNPAVKFARLPLKGFKHIVIQPSHIDLVNKYIDKIKSNGYEYSTLICQTNRHCSTLNQTVRRAVFPNARALQAGDLLMVTQNNYLGDLVNGDLVRVESTGGNEYRAGLNFINVQVVELSSGKRYALLLIENILNSLSPNITDKQHKDLMIDYYRRMKSRGIGQNSEAFKANMTRDPYLNALRADYGYAVTCHKSQGGEWDEVFLYLDNKIHGLPKPGIYQWWYTATTRAREKLHLVNDWFVT